MLQLNGGPEIDQEHLHASTQIRANPSFTISHHRVWEDVDFDGKSTGKRTAGRTQGSYCGGECGVSASPPSLALAAALSPALRAPRPRL